MMKFSYRVISIGVICLTILSLFIYFSSRHIWNHSFNFEVTYNQPSILSDIRLSKSQSNYSYSPIVCLNGTSPVSADVLSPELLLHINQNQQSRSRSLERRSELSGVYTPSGKKLTAIIVPHSHNDPGWHKTVEGYFHDQSKHTLDYMVEKLMKFPKMTFIWAESVFMSLWWEQLSSKTKTNLRQLIREGRVEIVVGSWVVPDEANPSYYALVDQMIEGHHWLSTHMNVTPTNTWSLDPFGYSSTLPYLYKRAGFDNMIILRVHTGLKELLQKDKSLEFMWRQHWDSTGSTDIRTQLMPYQLYNIKHTCGPDHDICLKFDFRNIPGEISESRAVPVSDHNVDELSRLLVQQYQKKADLFKHNVVLIPIGDDFRFDRSIEWDQQYTNYMKLFNYINSKKDWNIDVRFGTLKDYFSELDKAMSYVGPLPKGDLPTLVGDFFPYTDNDVDYWTGYFTSRPFDKALGRQLESQLRAADLLNTFALMSKCKHKFTMYDSNMQELEKAHQYLGLFQHHDAITGTSVSHVVADNERRLMAGITSSQIVLSRSAGYIMSSGKIQDGKVYRVVNSYSIDGTNEIISVTAEGITVTVFNSLSHDRKSLVRLHIDSDNVVVFDMDNNVINSQVNPVWLSNTKLSKNSFELIFYMYIPVLALGNIYIRLPKSGENTHCVAASLLIYNGQMPNSLGRFHTLSPGNQYINLENENYRIRFNTKNGFMHSITTKDQISTTKINLNFLMYKSRGSGAYLFKPAGPAVNSELDFKPLVKVIKGPLVSEVHSLQKLVQHKVFLHASNSSLDAALEIKNVVDLRTLDNKEMIMQLEMTTTNDNATSFYTDANGFHMIKRPLFKKLPVSANYYPMTSMVYTENDVSRLTIMSAQPLGVASLKAGDVEIMLDRRLSYDDGRGLGQGVLDNRQTLSMFYLSLEHRQKVYVQNSSLKKSLVSHPTLQTHQLFDMLNNPPIILVSQNNELLMSFRPMLQQLPADTRLVSLRSFQQTNLINNSRIAFIFHRLGVDCSFSSTLREIQNGPQINFSDLFSSEIKQIKNVNEMTLSLIRVLRKINIHEPVSHKAMELYAYVSYL